MTISNPEEAIPEKTTGDAGATRGRRRLPTRYIVGRVSDLPDGERLIVEIRGRSIGIFNVDGEFHALLNRCPHNGGPLCTGPFLAAMWSEAPGEKVHFDNSRKLVQCPWHGWEFDVTTGQSYLDAERTRVRSYTVEVERHDRVADEVGQGTAHSDQVDVVLTVPGPIYKTVLKHGEKGPFKAETVPIEVEGDYIVVTMH